MNVLKLADGLTWVGVQDPGLRVFDIIMHTEFGTTYNSYLLRGSRKTALFETCKLKCWDEYKAQETGRIAGANAAGEALSYAPIGSALSISAMNTGVFSLGTNGKGPNDDPAKLRTVEFKDPLRGNYEKYIFRNGVLAGVILVGDTSKMTAMTKAMDEGAGFAALFG